MQTPNFAKTLKANRQAANLSLQKLADKSSLTKTYIDTLEHGQRLPSVETIRKLSTALDVSPSVLIKPLFTDYEAALL